MQLERRCPPGSVQSANEICSCNDFSQQFNKERWECEAPRKIPFVNTVKSTLKTSLVALPQCPKKSSANDNGTCTCDAGYYMYERPQWICCPENSIADNDGFCFCDGRKSYFDHHHFICYSKIYLDVVITKPKPIIFTKPYISVCNENNNFCRFNITTAFPVSYKPCPEGMVGTPPYCSIPCPLHQYRKCFYLICFNFK